MEIVSANSDRGSGFQSMPKVFNVVVERDSDGYYVASVPTLPGCHTQAPSIEELRDRVREAIALHLEDRGEEAEPLEFIGVERVIIAA
ncbi:MAG: type II toxin-antitoxin system HicB family antitoxin, partial [Hyphomicrobium sp.]